MNGIHWMPFFLENNGKPENIPTMKPNYRRFTRSLPLMITIALGAPCLTNAAIFNDDTGRQRNSLGR